MKRIISIFIASLFLLTITACSSGNTGSSGGSTPPITITSGQFALAGFQTLTIDTEEINESVTAVMYLTVVNKTHQNFMIYLPAQSTFSYGNGSFLVESPVWTGSTTGNCMTARYRGIRRDLNDEDPLTMYHDETGTLTFSNCNMNAESLVSTTMIMTSSDNNGYRYTLSGFVSPVFDIMSIDANNPLYTGTSAPVLLVKMLASFDAESDLLPLELLTDIPFGNKDTLSKLITLLQTTESSFTYAAPISGQSAIFGTISGDISMDVTIDFATFIIQMNNILGTMTLSQFPQLTATNLAPASEPVTIDITGEGSGAVNNIFNPRGEVNGNYIMSVGINTEETASISPQLDLTLFSAYASMFPNYKESFVLSYANYTESLGKLFIFNPTDKAHLVLTMDTMDPNISTFYTLNIKLANGLTITNDDIVPQNEDIKCSVGNNNTIVCDFYQNANGRGTTVDLYVSQVTHQEGFTYPINVTTTQNATIVNGQTRIRFVTQDNPTESKSFAYISLPTNDFGVTRLNICNVATNTLAIESCAVASGFESENKITTISVDTTNKYAYIVSSESSNSRDGAIFSCKIDANTGALSDCVKKEMTYLMYSAMLDNTTNPNYLYVNGRISTVTQNRYIHVCPITPSTGAIGTCQIESADLGSLSSDYGFTINNNEIYYSRGTEGNPTGLYSAIWNGSIFSTATVFSETTSAPRKDKFTMITNDNGITYSTTFQDSKLYIFDTINGVYLNSSGVEINNTGNLGAIIDNFDYLYYQNNHIFGAARSYSGDGSSTIIMCNISNNTIATNTCTPILNVGQVTGEVNYAVKGIGFYNLPQ